MRLSTLDVLVSFFRRLPLLLLVATLHLQYPQSSRTATPGHFVNGGFGADGPRAGGGGGGGFYGGGGGGSGEQGGGGGGGSSFADTGALVLEDPQSEWGHGKNDMRVVGSGDSWVEVEWDFVVDALPGEEPLFYEVGPTHYHGRNTTVLAKSCFQVVDSAAGTLVLSCQELS